MLLLAREAHEVPFAFCVLDVGADGLFQKRFSNGTGTDCALHANDPSAYLSRTTMHCVMASWGGS